MGGKQIPPDQINLKLILVSGKTKEFLFFPNASVNTITQKVYENWPMEWADEVLPPTNILRLIYQGRFLHGNVTLGALQLLPGSTTVMHLVMREQLPEPNYQALQKEKSREDCCPICCCSICWLADPIWSPSPRASNRSRLFFSSSETLEDVYIYQQITPNCRKDWSSTLWILNRQSIASADSCVCVLLFGRMLSDLCFVSCFFKSFCLYIFVCHWHQDHDHYHHHHHHWNVTQTMLATKMHCYVATGFIAEGRADKVFVSVGYFQLHIYAPLLRSNYRLFGSGIIIIIVINHVSVTYQ